MSKQGLTPKQEKFAQGIASGMNQADAYRASFDAANCSDKTIHEKASRLANEGKVRARIEALTAKVVAEVAKGVRYELEDAMRECDAALKVATDAGNASAMARCVELKAKLNGLMVEDRKNQRKPLEELTDDQLDARIGRLTAVEGASVH